MRDDCGTGTSDGAASIVYLLHEARLRGNGLGDTGWEEWVRGGRGATSVSKDRRALLTDRQELRAMDEARITEVKSNHRGLQVENRECEQ